MENSVFGANTEQIAFNEIDAPLLYYVPLLFDLFAGDGCMCVLQKMVEFRIAKRH